MDKIEVAIKKIVPWAVIPEYDTAASAGCDLQIAIQEEQVLFPHEVTAFSTGLMMRIPDGYEGQIRSRAGMARKGLVVANAPATIDAESPKEITILLLNTTDEPVKLIPGQKVAQMVFSPVVMAKFDE